MRRSYLDYAMSVIVARALPDARDGLKPVHRRILYGMQDAGYTSDRPYRKSARVVGEVMGKYHPHGDAAIYDAMVRMAQPFSMRVPLIDGQGNFGSVDGDAPAAMRYTEVRLARAAALLLDDIDQDTVDFQPNYDESEKEPHVLPARFPNLLVNGGNGIAVGMATNIPPHNPGEIIDATLALIAEPDTSLDELMQIVAGPDFPTGGIILGRSGIRSAFETGRGSIMIRARAEFEEIRRDREAIVITEIPYQVNKSTLLERIGELVRAKQIEGIGEMRDESDRSGMRIVIELKRDATAEVVLNQLFRFTQLQVSFGVNMLALDGGRPRQMGLKDALQCFIAFREDVILRRARFELNKARDRAHLLVGLAIAVANIDEVIRLIRASNDAAAARAALMERDWPAADIGVLLALIDEPGNVISADGTVRVTEEQARGILELRLQRLTGLEREKIQEEMTEVGAKIRDLLEILASRPRRMDLMRDELAKARAEIASPRRTDIVEAAADQDDESLIEPGQMVVTITRDGFIKRTTLETYRAQNRGGRGRVGRLDPRRRHRDPQLPCAHASMGAVLLLGGQSVPREGLAPAGGRADREGQGAGEPAARTGLRHDHHGAAAAAGRDAVGQPASAVRHRVRQRAAQPAVGFPQRACRRPDRHEARRWRPADRRCDLPRGPGCVPGHAQGPLHPLRAVRRHGAGVRRPRQLRRSRHPSRRPATR